ncbi:MAG: tRNA uridine-5-carboxymethylaminomethyl(34) synthesis GTPase MnmE, partial [Clostridiales bacterium]|nr:tRNA uridine-5-carboxymethylaminomethyl(34) synthesis GTPase MnmE [Clostridiales bacterium]
TYKNEKDDNAVAHDCRAPKSSPRETAVEISGHGGTFIVQKTLEAVFDAGAYPAEPGEFTKRAFLNGKMDLTQAESVADLISAGGDAAAKASFNMLQGALSEKINNVLDKLMDSSALMAAWVDYPDEEIPQLDEASLKETLINSEKELKELLKSYDAGQIITQGIDAAIVGRPNAGKSTLMNLMAGREKSIVTDIAGTTRDIVEESVKLGEVVLHLSDTAGLRTSNDAVESIGIKRAYEKIENAALIIAVFDSSMPLNEDDFKLMEKCRNKLSIAVINKMDIKSKCDLSAVENYFDNVIHISANNPQSLKTLVDEVQNVLGVCNFDSSAPLLANIRQKNSCKNALNAVDEALQALNSGITFDAINVLIDGAVDELLALTGKKATTEVVNNIFSKFCVGK